MTKRNNIIYWTATAILALFMFVGGLAQIFKQKDNVDGIIHLGYPLYFMTILGVWKVLGVITILLPRFPLVKEWAYAGFFFAMTGAVISHIASGDPFAHFIAPLVFAILTVVSWYFRPAGRRI
jgi:hypothetical protein